MFKKIKLILLAIILVYPSFYWGQKSNFQKTYMFCIPQTDSLIWEGRNYSFYSLTSRNNSPLYLKKNIDSTRIFFYDTIISEANKYPYSIKWKVIGDQLYLTSIVAKNIHNKPIKANLKTVFKSGYKDSMVKASWISDTFYIPSGNSISYLPDFFYPWDSRSKWDTYEKYFSIKNKSGLVYMEKGHNTFFNKELILIFKNGKLVDKKTYENKLRKSIFTQEGKKLEKHVYRNINWWKIPKLKKSNLEIRIKIKSDENGIPSVIKSKFILKNYNSNLHHFKITKSQKRIEKEITRVINEIEDWDIYYKFGNFCQKEWILIIILDETKRRQFNI